MLNKIKLDNKQEPMPPPLRCACLIVNEYKKLHKFYEQGSTCCKVYNKKMV